MRSHSVDDVDPCMMQPDAVPEVPPEGEGEQPPQVGGDNANDDGSPTWQEQRHAASFPNAEQPDEERAEEEQYEKQQPEHSPEQAQVEQQSPS